MMIFLFGFSLTGQTNGLIPPSMSLYLCSILHLALDPKGNVSKQDVIPTWYCWLAQVVFICHFALIMGLLPKGK